MPDPQDAPGSSGGLEHLKVAIKHLEMAFRCWLDELARQAAQWTAQTAWRVLALLATVVAVLVGLAYVARGLAEYIQSHLPSVPGAGAMIVGLGIIVSAGVFFLLARRSK